MERNFTTICGILLCCLTWATTGLGQTTIAKQDFEGDVTDNWNYTQSESGFVEQSDNTGTPSGERIQSGSRSLQDVNSANNTLSFDAVNVSGYISKNLSIWNAMISGTVGNGLDANSGDYLEVYVSNIATQPTTPLVVINAAASNQRWGMSGTGVINATAGGAQVTQTYTGGNPTTHVGSAAFSNISISIPDAWTTVYLWIEKDDNSADEIWCLDNIVLSGISTSTCNISDIAVAATGSCNDNGTPADPADDYYLADVTVTYTDAPATGTLDLSGAGLVAGGTTSAAVGTSPQTLSGVRLRADGSDVSLTAGFSDDNPCTYSETVAGSGVSSCSDAPTVGFATATSDALELDMGSNTVAIDVEISAAPTEDIVVQVNVSGASSAQAEDYGFSTTQLTFTPAGSTTQSVSLSIFGDTNVEPDETVVLDLSLVSGTAAIGTDEHTHTILNNDVPPLVINEIHADPDATEGDANGDGTTSTTEDEFIELYNNSDDPLDVSNWTVSDNTTVRYTFPDGTSIPARTAYVIFDDGDLSRLDCPAVTAGFLGLNNGGDQITIRDASNTIVTQASYGSEGGDNQSLARSPDFTGSFVKHTTLPGGARFSPCYSNTDNSVVLPIVLKSFKASAERNRVVLDWTTAAETDNDYFAIERSPDGRNFTTIDRVAGAGSTDQAANYTYADERPLNGRSYYRLRQVDFDGTTEFFGPVAVTLGDGGKPSVYVWPNPAADRLTLEGELDSGSRATLLDLSGRPLRHWTLLGKELRQELSLSDLVAGVYWLRITSGTTVQTVRFVKK